MSRLVIHIDKLVLRGIDRREAATVTASLKSELERQLAEPGRALVHTASAPSIDAGRQKVARGDAAGMGAVLAGKIGRSLFR